MLKISLLFKKNTDFQICISVPLKVLFRKCATYVLGCSFIKRSLTDW